MPIAGFYYTYGDDSTMIEKKWLPDLQRKYLDAEWIRLDASIDDISVPSLVTEYNVNDLFSKGKVIVIRNADKKQEQADQMMEDGKEYQAEKKMQQKEKKLQQAEKKMQKSGAGLKPAKTKKIKLKEKIRKHEGEKIDDEMKKERKESPAQRARFLRGTCAAPGQAVSYRRCEVRS